MRDNRQGCLSGLLQLFLVKKVYDWGQQKFGYGNGVFGCGCGCLLTILFIGIVLSILSNTNLFKFGF